MSDSHSIHFNLQSTMKGHEGSFDLRFQLRPPKNPQKDPRLEMDMYLTHLVEEDEGHSSIGLKQLQGLRNHLRDILVHQHIISETPKDTVNVSAAKPGAPLATYKTNHNMEEALLGIREHVGTYSDDMFKLTLKPAEINPSQHMADEYLGLTDASGASPVSHVLTSHAPTRNSSSKTQDDHTLRSAIVKITGRLFPERSEKQKEAVVLAALTSIWKLSDAPRPLRNHEKLARIFSDIAKREFPDNTDDVHLDAHAEPAYQQFGDAIAAVAELAIKAIQEHRDRGVKIKPGSARGR